MKKIPVLLLLITTALLVSCDNTPSNKRAADGYYFERESFVRTDFPVEIILVESKSEMVRLFKERRRSFTGSIQPENLAAFSVIRLNDTKCTIYMIDPKVSYEPEYIGHELVHCIYGVWHSQPQK